MDGTVEAGQATYDAAGRMTELELQPDASNPTHHTFVYDTLGRLIFATDPDIGDRTLTYNDAGFLTEATNAADQSIDYNYDGAGRLVSVLADDGSFFNYHYDDALDSGTYANTAGRLAWISEPTGQVQIGYDTRGRQVKSTREIQDGSTWTGTATEDMRFAPSGLLRSIDYNDGLSIDYTYDDAGRPVQVGNLWTASSYDPAGRLLAEQFGNGVTGAYGYDVNGDVSSVEVDRPSAAGGSPFYQVSLTRNGFGAIDSVTDADGTGLNHTASFTYDGAGRLTAATLGPATSQYQFSYSYDGLQNMIQRTASGPGNLGALEGDYRYGGTRPAGLGGGSYGPRQLTGIAPAGSDPMDPPDHTMAYDLAGRQVAQDDLTLTYNGLDQLTEVDGLSTGSGTVQHAYGYDGLRVMTRGADGSTQYWFSTDVSQVGTVRQHSIRLGDRLIARVDQHDLSPNVVAPPVSTDGGDLLRRVGVALLLLLLVVVCAGFAASGPRARARGRRLAPATAAVAAAALLQPGCALLGFSQHPSWENVQTLYFHQGVSPGPTLITRQDGTLQEERRYEPFGQPLDAFRELEGGGTETGAVDFTVDPHNILNKETNPDTGWSYHGARWMAPETARWLTPDPPVKAPNPDLIAAPWTAHPYQYVLQNPIVFWDPDGRDRVCEGSACHAPRTTGRSYDLNIPASGASPAMQARLGRMLPGGPTPFERALFSGSLKMPYGVTLNSTTPIVTHLMVYSEVRGYVLHLRGQSAFGEVVNRYGNHAVKVGGDAVEDLGLGPLNYLIGGLAARGIGGFAAGGLRGGVADDLAESIAARGGLAPVQQGAAGVERAVVDLETAGGRVLGREVTIEAGGVRTRPDLFVELPNGQQAFLEIKTGASARLTPNQSIAFPQVWTQGAIPRGANAAAAGLTPGAAIGPTPVWTVHYPWPLP